MRWRVTMRLLVPQLRPYKRTDGGTDSLRRDTSHSCHKHWSRSAVSWHACQHIVGSVGLYVLLRGYTVKYARTSLVLSILACSSSKTTAPVISSSEEGVYTLASIRGVAVPSRNVVRGSATLGPGHAFSSSEYDGSGSTLTDSVFQSGTYAVNGTDVFGINLTVHISAGTDNGQPFMLPPNGVNLTYVVNGSTLTWRTGSTPFYVYQKVGP